MNMRLLGANTIKDVVPAMVNARSLSSHVTAVPEDRLYGSNCTRFFFLFSGVEWLILWIVIVAYCVDESMQSAHLREIKAKL